MVNSLSGSLCLSSSIEEGAGVRSRSFSERHIKLSGDPRRYFEPDSKRRGSGNGPCRVLSSGLGIPALTRVGCCHLELHGGSVEPDPPARTESDVGQRQALFTNRNAGRTRSRGFGTK